MLLAHGISHIIIIGIISWGQVFVREVSFIVSIPKIGYKSFIKLANAVPSIPYYQYFTLLGDKEWIVGQLHQYS